jgi:DNA mismatch endonuclease (patch repair protein)
MDRSAIMRSVKSKNTRPELVVRRLIHSLGYRYRLHVKALPGNPDLVFPSRRKIINIHGCFWHGHDCRRGARLPKENSDYWREKLTRNRDRDLQSEKELQVAGWDVLTIWECETPLKQHADLALKIQRFLNQ